MKDILGVQKEIERLKKRIKESQLEMTRLAEQLQSLKLSNFLSKKMFGNLDYHIYLKENNEEPYILSLSCSDISSSFSDSCKNLKTISEGISLSVNKSYFTLYFTTYEVFNSFIKDQGITVNNLINYNEELERVNDLYEKRIKLFEKN